VEPRELAVAYNGCRDTSGRPAVEDAGDDVLEFRVVKPGCDFGDHRAASFHTTIA
jgi:hypothetical protein